MKTIIIDNIAYNKYQNCKDSELIDYLIEKKKLRNDINKKNYLINDCDDLSYITYEKISYGGFNEVYKIMDDKKNLISNKVLRVTKMNKINNEKADKELEGLFMQSYFSKICNNICKVYEFGKLFLVDKSYDNYAYRNRYRTYAILEILVPLNEIMEKAIEYKKSDINFRNVFYGILTGLSCIHSKKYVHLDIKEYNIGIDEEKNAKIFDFGESVYLDKEDNYLSGDIHGFLCTMRYEAPEIFRNNHVFFNSDVFSLAIIMLKLYCNKWMGKNYFTLRHIFNQVKDRSDPTSLENLYRFIFEKSKIEENGQNRVPGIVFRHFRDYFDNDISNIYQKIETNNKKQKDSDSINLRILLTKMLQFDPKVRISSTDALKEFWIKVIKKTADSKNNSKVNNNNNSKEFIKNLSKVNNNNSKEFIKNLSEVNNNNSKEFIKNLSKVNNTGATKTFVIDHPVNPEKYLVHACLEGPEAGVYYRGKGEIKNGSLSETIELPNYVSSFATDLTVQVTPIYNGKINILNASEVENNLFTVYGESSCNFNWVVYGKRSSINTEPYKNDVYVKGSGPYLWI